MKPEPKIYVDVRHERTAERFLRHGIRRGKDLDGCRLTERQRAIVCAYLGLDGLAPTSMPSLALVFKMTKQGIWCHLHAALRRVQRYRYETRPE